MSIDEMSYTPERANAEQAPPRTIVFVAYPHIGLLDLTAAQTVFFAANHGLVECGLPGYTLHTASMEGGPVPTAEGLVVETRRLSEFIDSPIDSVIVPGSPQIRQVMADSPALVDWLRVTSTTARRMASVCSGTFLLAQAGLLDGLRVATHWVMADVFERLFPQVELDREAIFVQQQSVWTSAGISAGIDLALALVEADCGREMAMQVARRMVVYYRRPDNQDQWSPLLQSQCPAGA
ncbi:AraC family transcriptional regulator [Pseudomonas izuensis]|uniref:AraC family transcriptional regulator n=1 Tax=Pseudomonas izuensis TaxID=2684212 RepID=A0ABM7RWJ9_9PSED|nr:AraC family transcriptional regulator [Pseudomonas izuensis]BCX69221.1 AraC family transcriptional regulator [Pseudomonas izuensis]